MVCITVTELAILDLTGNTNATPINPGAITFQSNTKIIYDTSTGSATAELSPFTAATISNNGVIQLSTVSGGTVTTGRHIQIIGSTWIASNCTFESGYSTQVGGCFQVISGGTAHLVNVTIRGCTSTIASATNGLCPLGDGTEIILDGCTIGTNCGTLLYNASKMVVKDTTLYSTIHMRDAVDVRITVQGTLMLNAGARVAWAPTPVSTPHGTITLEDNTIIILSNDWTAGISTPIAALTLNIGANCKIWPKGGTAYVNLASGTYTSASISSNGVLSYKS